MSMPLPYIDEDPIETPIVLADAADKHAGHDLNLVRRQDLVYKVALAGTTVQVDWESAEGGSEDQSICLICDDCGEMLPVREGDGLDWTWDPTSGKKGWYHA